METVDDLAGLGASHPAWAFGLTICLLSLTGIPPLAGFWGKLAIFGSLLAAGEREASGSYLTLAVIGMLSAAAGAYYYLRVVVVMYFRPSKDPIRVTGGWPVSAAVGTCVILTVLVGLYSTPLSTAAHMAAQSALSHPQPAQLPVASTEPRATVSRSLE